MYNFIHIPKVAGTSFFELINKNHLPIRYVGHYEAHGFTSEYPSFAFVRNPYDRLVDAYFYLIKGGQNTEIDLSFMEILKPYEDFKDFVFSIEKDDLMEKIIHIQAMNYFVCDDDHKIIVNKIFFLEDIDSIDYFLFLLGCKEKLSETKKNICDYPPFMEVMDAEIIAEINRLYSLDFQLFNYKKL